MNIKLSLVALSLLVSSISVVFSYTVAKEMYQQVDFDTMVKLQDHISRRFDKNFSYFSVLGSAEITFSIIGIFIIINLFKLKIIPVVGWLAIIPASVVEILGKLIIFHPAPPVIFHRTITQTHLPSFYIHTNFSYPSGHMMRTSFLITIFLVMILTSKQNLPIKILTSLSLITVGFLMFLTRVYLGEHWLSDVVGGLLIGSASGLFASGLILSKKIQVLKK